MMLPEKEYILYNDNHNILAIFYYEKLKEAYIDPENDKILFYYGVLEFEENEVEFYLTDVKDLLQDGVTLIGEL